MLLVRLKKISTKNNLSYVIVVSSPKSSPTGSKFLEQIGFYKPLTNKWLNKYTFVDMDRLSFWLKRGAKINNSVYLLVKPLLLNSLKIKNI
jgi:ribosomal protein S16